MAVILFNAWLLVSKGLSLYLAPKKLVIVTGRIVLSNKMKFHKFNNSGILLKSREKPDSI
jgi:hypothetical protein